jgi:gamma-glutamyltranspeptidase/glutathione hydrolase
MTPTIVLKNGRPLIVTGSPGGSRINTAVLQILVNVIDRKLAAADAVAAPRFHHQWMPDEVFVEEALPPETVAALQARGHKVNRRPPFTSANTILVTPRGYVGAADPRTRGSLAVGY